MDSVQSQFKRHLKQQGYSLTGSRQAIFDALQGKEPQTMRQLVAVCPDIDRASVYRTITLFEQLGIAQRVQIGWKYKLELTDTFSRHHHHLTCLKCGRVTSFDESPQFEAELARVATDHNFRVNNHQLEIQGLCSRCAA